MAIPDIGRRAVVCRLSESSGWPRSRTLPSRSRNPPHWTWTSYTRCGRLMMAIHCDGLHRTRMMTTGKTRSHKARGGLKHYAGKRGRGKLGNWISKESAIEWVRNEVYAIVFFAESPITTILDWYRKSCLGLSCFLLFRYCLLAARLSFSHKNTYYRQTHV